jgi:streptogrisin C
MEVKKRIACAAAAAALLSMATPAFAAPAPAPSSAMDNGSAIDAGVNAYLKSYPQMSKAQALAATKGQEKRKAVVSSLIEQHNDSFGGAWFDPPTGVLHISATKPATVASAERVALRHGVKLATHLVTRSFTELEQQATALRKGEGELGKAAQGRVGIDVTTNEVTVALPQNQLHTTRVPAGVKLIADPGTASEPDHGCTARNACDYTIRAGAMIWYSGGPNWCSAGFTARDANNQRIVYTAGHCTVGAGVNWGTGTEAIGPMWTSQDSGAVDGAVINVTNSWFTGDRGGEIYLTALVKGVAPFLSYIVAGETVCLSANFTVPTGGNFCGTVGTNSDAGNRGLVRVDGFDACGGDSGGGWYWLPASGNRVAYGLHSRSDFGCHSDSGGTRSWFSAIPTVRAAIAPTFNVELG